MRTALASLFLSAACLAQTSAPPVSASATPDSFADQAFVFDRIETAYRMHADGTGQREMRVVIRLQSQGAAQKFGDLTFAYASANETPQIKLVRVHKPDGTTVDTPAADAMDMPAAVTREAPLYSDLREKHLPVRSLSVGDTLEYDFLVSIDKADAPGQFWGADHFTVPGTFIVREEVLTLEFPSNKYVQVWSPNHQPTIADHSGTRTYTWNIAQLIPAPKNNGDDSAKSTPPKDPDEDADGRKLPSVAWTTFHNWAEVGDWYRSLSSTRVEPNDAVRARAAELTKDAKTPEDRVRALYEFVSTRTRYIGIDFGVGRYQPHAAADVLTNQYGDCKDKDTLLEALLRAQGFTTAPALIGAGIAPVADLPSPAVFNHVITTVDLPSGQIWLDSTPAVAPYRFLTSPIRDQKALVVPASAPAQLELTPAAGPWPYNTHFTADATLDAEGKLTGKITASYRDDEEIMVRALALEVAPAEWDKASQYISSMTGFSGTTSNTKFTNLDDDSSPITVSYDYARHPYGDWDDRRILPLFPALDFTNLGDDAKEPEEDIQLGPPRTLTATSTIHLPDGYRVDFPDPIHVKTDFATFDKTYRFDGKQIVADRTIVVLKDKLPKSDWKRYQTFTKDISLEGENWIQLIQPQKKLTIVTKSPEETAKSTPAPGAKPNSGSKTITVQNLPILHAPADTAAPPASEEPIPDNASAMDLLRLATDRLRAGDPGGTKEILDKIKAKNPDQEYLWGLYGAVAEAERDNDEAKTDYRKELAAHPDNPGVVGALAALQSRTSDSIGARQTLRQFLEKHPDNLQLSMYLAGLQTNAKDFPGALKTLESAADQHPDNRYIRVQVANILVQLNRNEEAAAAAKSVLDGADDPELLNNAAYALSETGHDLPLAEDASRRSIAKLEEKSATISAQEANSRTFGEANLIIASWDTLGWILFRESKYDAAKPYLSAAWRDSERAEIADHLGQVDEALGHNNDAATDYALGLTALTETDTPDIRGHIKDSIARLAAAGSKPTGPTGTGQLQDLRTYKIDRPKDLSGWATWRLEITTAGVIESQQMSGETKLADLKKPIDQMKFPELLPPDSKAHLLRSAVVSCSVGTTCELVLVPNGSLQTEQP